MHSQAFLDESGGADTGHMVLAGWVGSVEMWRVFSDDWRRSLDRFPALPPFHAVDFEGCSNGFEVLAGDEKRKHARLRDLVLVIQKHRPTGVAAIVDIPDFMSRVPEPSGQRLRRKRQHWRYPYSFAAHNLIGSLCGLHEAVGADLGTVDILLDHFQQLHRQVALGIEKRVRVALEEDSPTHARRLGTIRWRTREERGNDAGLQAADMLAWHVRRAVDTMDGMDRPAYRSLKQCDLRFITEHRVDSIDEWIRGWRAIDDAGPSDH